ncbi:hypothetical protein C1879_04955 [Paraeggerthella hongkongensis]|jgi:hypothetical protein|nr:hypothetical protein C1879_04955 [Paraeggerthella hongkongensis]
MRKKGIPMNDSKTSNAYKILVVMLSVAILVTGGLLLAKTMNKDTSMTAVPVGSASLGGGDQNAFTTDEA